MDFGKFPHPANFDFAPADRNSHRARIGRTTLERTLHVFEGGLCRFELTRPGQPAEPLNDLLPGRRMAAAQSPWSTRPGFGLRLTDASGDVLCESVPGRSLGVAGPNVMYAFGREASWRFYGLGEKVRGLEHSGCSTKLWNTDVLCDFAPPIPEHGRPDPYYASIPYLIIHTGSRWIGLLLHTSYPTFIRTGESLDGQPVILMGSEGGTPDLYAIAATTLAELTRRFQQLVGTTPMPPIWALGYHQCRWGYRSAADLEGLDRNFRKHGIPCDGLWLDIDYMRGFRVFTFDRKHFPNPARTFRALLKRGRRVIPILDPGVKREPGYPVFDEGRRGDLFCRNRQGGLFVGLVWPGETVFPDFALPATRRWWARQVRDLAKRGIGGAWIDMNDPSTGNVDPADMLFGRSQIPHAGYRNLYALGMAQATRAGLQNARPAERPFLLSRSGSTGIGALAALWTGDNFSNYHHLRNVIPTSLNLALSGVPFNGPDIGGFAGNTSPQLIRDWMKLCFLFPFCRNHSCAGTRDQEPWAFDRLTRGVLTHFIRLRYKLRPYLYHLFRQQASSGEAILRPLIYEFEPRSHPDLTGVDDQFMVGPAVMQAPLLDEQKRRRRVKLPGGSRWYDARAGRWLLGGTTVAATPSEEETALYFRDGTLVPMTPGLPTTQAWRPLDLEVHVFLANRNGAAASLRYVVDDGITAKGRQARQSVVEINATVARGLLEIRTRQVENGLGTIRPSVIVHDRFKRGTLNGKAAGFRGIRWAPAGRTITAWRLMA